MEEQAKKIAEMLKLLANEQRLLILCALVSEPMSVSRIYDHTPNITKSALSQHLIQLKNAGILDSQKQGLNVIYRIQDRFVVELMEFFKKRYCVQNPIGDFEVY